MKREKTRERKMGKKLRGFSNLKSKWILSYLVFIHFSSKIMEEKNEAFRLSSLDQKIDREWVDEKK